LVALHYRTWPVYGPPT